MAEAAKFDLSEFPFVLREMIETRVSIGRSGKDLGVFSMSTLNNLIVLRRLCLERKPQRTLEVGFCQGGSALVFTQCHKDLGRPPEHQHIALDPYQRWPFVDERGLIYVEKAGLSGYLDFREEFSCFALPELVKQGAKFGIIYIDGSHLFEDVFVDFYYTSQLLEDDGIILIDDSAYNQVQKAVRFIRRNRGPDFPEFDLRPYRDADKFGKYWLARVLHRQQLTAFQRTGKASRVWDAPYQDF